MRYNSWKTLLLCPVLIAGATPALGVPVQSAPRHADSGADIVVTGKRRDPDKTITQTRAISNPHDGQLARFETPVCPIVIGLPKLHRDIVEARIREVAGAAKIPVDKPGCSANLTVVVAQDGAAFVDQLHRQRPLLFDSVHLHELEKLLQSRGPSWTWQFISPRRRDGAPVERIDFMDLGFGPEPVSRGAYIVHNADLSRLVMSARQDINLAFVVLDEKTIVGHTLRQVADYAAMVGLVAIRTDKSDRLLDPSILTLFEDTASGRVAQPQATSFDLAYLSSLYSGDSGVSSDQRSQAMAIQINRRMKP